MPIRRSWFNIYFEWFFRYLKTLPQTSSENGVWSVFEAKTEKQIYMIFLIFGLTFFENIWDKIFCWYLNPKRLFLAFKIWWRVFSLFLGWIIHQVKQTLFFYGVVEQVEKVRGLVAENWWYSGGTSWLVGELTILAAQA